MRIKHSEEYSQFQTHNDRVEWLKSLVNGEFEDDLAYGVEENKVAMYGMQLLGCLQICSKGELVYHNYDAGSIFLLKYGERFMLLKPYDDVRMSLNPPLDIDLKKKRANIIFHASV